VTPLKQVRTCVCARGDLRAELILEFTHCSLSQSVRGATAEWTQENTSAFIELHDKISLLWDPNHPKYYNNLHKHGAWEDRAKAMGTVPEECKKKTDLFIKSLVKNTN
jgi:hypothetical protein